MMDIALERYDVGWVRIYIGCTFYSACIITYEVLDIPDASFLGTRQAFSVAQEVLVTAQADEYLAEGEGRAG